MPKTCPRCGQPTGPRKMGRKPVTAEKLRAAFDHGRGFTVEEAATALGLTPAAIRSALRRMDDAHALGPFNGEKIWAIKPKT